MDVRDPICCGLFVAERALGDHPDKFGISLDVFSIRALVGECAGVRHARDVIADLGPVRDILADVDDNAREVATENTSRSAELPVDVCGARQRRTERDDGWTYASSRSGSGR